MLKSPANSPNSHMATTALVTILIPSYNEGQRLLTTLQFLHTHFPRLSIVVIDDASDDATAKLRSKSTARLRVIHHSTNQGKTAAIKTGLTSITTPYVCLFDADLTNLNPTQIATGFALLTDHSPAMVVFSQTQDTWVWQRLNLQIFFSGERCLKTQLLQEFLTTTLCSDYDLEIKLHEWLAARHHTYLTTPFTSTNQLKIRKWHPLVAAQKSWSLYRQWLSWQFWLTLYRLNQYHKQQYHFSPV